MKNIILVLLVVVIGLLISCEKKEVSLSTEVQPPYTDMGTNILSCYIDGKLKIFIDPTYRTSTHYVKVEYSPFNNISDTTLFINTSKQTDTNSCSLSFYIRHFTDTGKYILSHYEPESKSWALYDVGRTPQTNVLYASFKGSTIEVHVKKLDTIRKIVAGTFSGKLRIYQYGPEILSITNGQFDYKYDEYR